MPGDVLSKRWFLMALAVLGVGLGLLMGTVLQSVGDTPSGFDDSD